MDTIFIRELRLSAWIGLYRHEKLAPQTLEFDIEIGLPKPEVFATGRVADTIDYAVVVERLKALFAAERFGLVESLAERVARVLIDEFGAPRARVSVAKLGVLREARRVGVVVERTTD